VVLISERNSHCRVVAHAAKLSTGKELAFEIAEAAFHGLYSISVRLLVEQSGRNGVRAEFSGRRAVLQKCV
jgi:hypothetical protein